LGNFVKGFITAFVFLLFLLRQRSWTQIKNQDWQEINIYFYWYFCLEGVEIRWIFIFILKLTPFVLLIFVASISQEGWDYPEYWWRFKRFSPMFVHQPRSRHWRLCNKNSPENGQLK